MPHAPVFYGACAGGVVWALPGKLLGLLSSEQKRGAEDLAESVRNCKFHVSMFHIQCLFFFFFPKLWYIYRGIFFLPSPFSLPSQEPKVLEILLRDVCIANCPISLTLMASSKTCTSLSVCNAPNQTQQMTVTENQDKWPKQTLWYTEDQKGLFFTISTFFWWCFFFSFLRSFILNITTF